MAEINIKLISSEEGGFIYDVTVTEDRASTAHRVGLRQAYYNQLTEGKLPPQDLVKKSFEFLLKREPKESILRAFNIREISTYFPEFEKEMRNL